MRKIVSGLLLTLVFSCSEKETTPPEASKTQHITAAGWKYESGGADVNRDGTIDITVESMGFPSCRLDNAAVFSANGTGVTDEGATKCNASDPQTLPFTWNFSNNETILNVVGAGFFGITGQFTITALNATRMTLTKDTTISSVNTSLIVNLRH